jgi:response regulator RpfG family c-di-GMP phosphodiesterase
MSLKYKHALLFVDDEESITKSLNRLFRKEQYEIYTASSGQEGLQVLKDTGKPFSLIISDQRMPGMSGSEFLEKAKEIFPYAIRILLTGYSDMNAIVDAVNKGQIHRYFAKPWNDDDLVLHIRQCLEQYELLVENRRLLALTQKQNLELTEFTKKLEEKVTERTREVAEKNEGLSALNKELEKNLYNTVRAFSSFVEMLIPSLEGHGRRVGSISRRLAEGMGLPEEEINQTEIAGLLHDLGKVGLPNKLLESKTQEDWTAEEKAIFGRHPERGQAAVQFIDKLSHAGILIRCHHEQYDGQGYPNQLAEEEIPLGARIIAVADAFDKVVNLKRIDRETLKKAAKGQSLTEEAYENAAVLHLKEGAFIRYDPDVIKTFLEILKGQGFDFGREKEHTLEEIQAGMVLSRPLHTRNGRFLVPQDTILSKELIRKLKAVHSIEPLSDVIHVRAE